MYNEFTPLISEEQLGAFLEGNLSESEIMSIRNLISHDELLKEILEINNIVDENINQFDNSEFLFNDELIDIDSFELPTVGNIELFSDEYLEMSAINDNQFKELNSFGSNEYDSLKIEENLETFNPDNNTLDL